MKNNMENSPNERRTFCNETLRPLSAPPILNLLNFASTDLLYHSYYTKHSKKDVRLPLPDFFFEGQAYLSTYFYDLNECNCKICGICTINTIESVLMTKKSLVERINEDFPSDVSPYNGETRCTTPIGQKKEPDNLLMFDILQFVSLNKAFFFKNTDNVITSDSLTKEIIIMLCKDQEASRFIQKRLEYATESELDWLFDSISNHLIELSCDLFGNYVIQKYITTHGEIIYDILRNRLSILSYDIYGCRVVQKLLDSIYFNLEDEFCNSVIDLTKDQNGNHVIQKVIEAGKIVFYAEPEEVYVFNKEEEVSIKFTETTNEKIEFKAMSEPISQNLVIENTFKDTKSENLNSANFQDELEFDYSSKSEISQNEEPSTQITTPKNEFYRIKFLINDFEKHTLEMCKHKYGCRAVQRLFEFCYEECDSIIQTILENLDDLIYDQYGNYVIQHLLNYENERNIILDFLCENVMKLSCHKFASNVVEKGISVSGENIFRIGDAIKDKYNIITLANSGFGNYVLQRMIESNDKRIKEICKGNASELRKCTYGKQVLSKVNMCKI